MDGLYGKDVTHFIFNIVIKLLYFNIRELLRKHPALTPQDISSV